MSKKQKGGSLEGPPPMKKLKGVNPIQYEIEQNSKNPQWKEMYMQEFQKQSGIYKDIVGTVVPFADSGIE